MLTKHKCVIPLERRPQRGIKCPWDEGPRAHRFSQAGLEVGSDVKGPRFCFVVTHPSLDSTPNKGAVCYDSKRGREKLLHANTD